MLILIFKHLQQSWKKSFNDKIISCYDSLIYSSLTHMIFDNNSLSKIIATKPILNHFCLYISCLDHDYPYLSHRVYHSFEHYPQSKYQS